MGKLVVLGLTAILALTASPARSEEEATFREFEASCRLGDNIDPSCELAVFGAYGYLMKVKTAECDWAKFWNTADKGLTEENASLPWQIGVGAVVQYPGVCHAIN